MFDHIVGNEIGKAYLKRIVERETIGNSLLFSGSSGIGKSLFAEAFAKLIICHHDPSGCHLSKVKSGNHPDIRVFRPEGKIGMHTIASMRQFSQEVYLSPYEAKYKVFIIHEADRMLSYSANALLKTFEEPAEDTIIILLSNAASSLLPTVVSRCRTIRFQTLTDEEIVSFLVNRCQKSTEEAEKIAILSQGSIGNAVRLIQEGQDPLRKQVIDLLSKGGFSTYKELSDTAAQIAATLDAGSKGVEADARLTLLKGTNDGMTATQKQSVEKEVEGAVAVHAIKEAESLFSIILSWYRDLHLIGVKGDDRFAIHRDSLGLLYKQVEMGGYLPLEVVQKAVKEASLALERSTSLHLCIENLFLKLSLVK